MEDLQFRRGPHGSKILTMPRPVRSPTCQSIPRFYSWRTPILPPTNVQRLHVCHPQKTPP